MLYYRAQLLYFIIKHLKVVKQKYRYSINTIYVFNNHTARQKQGILATCYLVLLLVVILFHLVSSWLLFFALFV